MNSCLRTNPKLTSSLDRFPNILSSHLGNDIFYTMQQFSQRLCPQLPWKTVRLWPFSISSGSRIHCDEFYFLRIATIRGGHPCRQHFPRTDTRLDVSPNDKKQYSYKDSIVTYPLHSQNPNLQIPTITQSYRAPHSVTCTASESWVLLWGDTTKIYTNEYWVL